MEPISFVKCAAYASACVDKQVSLLQLANS